MCYIFDYSNIYKYPLIPYHRYNDANNHKTHKNLVL